MGRTKIPLPWENVAAAAARPAQATRLRARHAKHTAPKAITPLFESETVGEITVVHAWGWTVKSTAGRKPIARSAAGASRRNSHQSAPSSTRTRRFPIRLSHAKSM